MEQNRQEITKELRDLKLRKTELKEEEKTINARISAIEYDLITDMEESGETKFATAYGTVSITTKLYPQITDMGAFVKFMHDNNRGDFVQKRPSAPAFREYFKLTGEYPEGLDAFDKTTLSFRKR
jgi:hypothetical protein